MAKPPLGTTTPNGTQRADSSPDEVLLLRKAVSDITYISSSAFERIGTLARLALCRMPCDGTCDGIDDVASALRMIGDFASHAKNVIETEKDCLDVDLRISGYRNESAGE